MRLWHLIVLFFLGIPYLLYQIVWVDCAFMVQQAFREVPPQYSLLFNRRLYRVFKGTLYSFPSATVPLASFLQALDSQFSLLSKTDQV